MASIRLTNTMRELIRNRLLEKRFAPEEKALQDAFTKLADDIGRSLLTPKQWKMVEELPEGWLKKTNGVRAAFAGQRKDLTMGAALAFPDSLYGDSYYRRDVEALFPADHKFTERFTQLTQREAELKQERQQCKREIEGVLSSCSTLGKLHEIWPESKQVSGDMGTPPASHGVPAIVINDLNAKLGLLKKGK